MSEASFENVNSEDIEDDDNRLVTTREEAGEDEVVVSNTKETYQDSHSAEPEEFQEEGSFEKRPLWEDDGSDASWVKKVLGELVLWRYPIHSGLSLVVFLLVFFLVKVSEYSIVTLACYLILLQLIATTAAIRGAPVLKSMGLLRSSFDPKTFALQRQAFSAEELFRFSRGCAEIASTWILDWNDTLETKNAKKVLRVAAGAFGLAIVGIVIPFDVTLLVTVFLSFTVFKVYEMQQESIDEITSVLQERYNERILPFLEKLYPILDSLLYRLEPIIGRFED
jgi:hypothetical protein